jgi:UDP-4-amino-4,6-dideoxy-N-acetyl-beta-L-altrosamine N-acetyltransferase
MIVLRDVRTEDENSILRWRNLPEVADYMYTDHRITTEEHKRWFQRMLDDRTSRYWIIVCDGEDVGLANIYDLDEPNRRCSWAFYVASPNVRGKGVGSFVEYSVLSFVFDELKLHRLCCEVLGFNEAVVEMHRSFGFEQEGLFRQHVFKAEQAIDVVYLAMLRQEWESRKPGVEGRLREKGIL